MNRKLLIGLILVLAGAFFALKQQDKNRGKKRAPQSLKTALLNPEAAAKIQKISIENKDSLVTLEKKDGSWGVTEEKGFPLNAEKLTKLFNALQSEQRLVKMTTEGRNFEKLGLALEKGKKPGDKTTVLRLFNSASAQNADKTLIYGKTRGTQRPVMNAGATPRYFRTGDEKSGWVLTEVPDLDSKSTDWISKTLVSIKADEIKKFSRLSSNSDLLVLEKASDNKSWLLGDLKTSETLKVPAADELIKFFENTEFNKITDKDEDNKEIAVFKLSLTDGTELSMNMTEKKDEKSSEHNFSISALGSSKTALKITKHFAGKTFSISSYKAEALFKKRSDLVEEKKAVPKKEAKSN